jgi:hypothetical protein
MKTKNKQKRRIRRRAKADLGYVHASKLVGQVMLVIGLEPAQDDYPYARFIVRTRLQNGSRLHFHAGVVVEQQIKETPLPIWARLLWREGIKHPYYILELARTISVERAGTPQS